MVYSQNTATITNTLVHFHYHYQNTPSNNKYIKIQRCLIKEVLKLTSHNYKHTPMEIMLHICLVKWVLTLISHKRTLIETLRFYTSVGLWKQNFVFHQFLFDKININTHNKKINKRKLEKSFSTPTTADAFRSRSHVQIQSYACGRKLVRPEKRNNLTYMLQRVDELIFKFSDKEKERPPQRYPRAGWEVVDIKTRQLTRPQVAWEFIQHRKKRFFTKEAAGPWLYKSVSLHSQTLRIFFEIRAKIFLYYIVEIRTSHLQRRGSMLRV